MIPDKDEQQIFHELLQENKKLLSENNELLRKINQRSVWGFWIKVVGLLILVGVPFALYYYIIEPYFYTVSESLKTLNEGLMTVPGWSQFIDAVSYGKGKN
jgi:hypothetical protein